MNNQLSAPDLNLDELRQAIQHEYEAVARNPSRGFHFHTGQSLARLLGYENSWLEGIPEGVIASMAGTGNPFKIGKLQAGEKVIDIGSGAGIDSIIAANKVGPKGQVIGVDMTPAMVQKAQAAANETGIKNLTFQEGYGEALPIPDEWADVIISNGVLNLMPDKNAALQEMARVLKPDGRLQIADILVEKEVPTSAKQKIDLWTG